MSLTTLVLWSTLAAASSNAWDIFVASANATPQDAADGLQMVRAVDIENDPVSAVSVNPADVKAARQLLARVRPALEQVTRHIHDDCHATGPRRDDVTRLLDLSDVMLLHATIAGLDKQNSEFRRLMSLVIDFNVKIVHCRGIPLLGVTVANMARERIIDTLRWLEASEHAKKPQLMPYYRKINSTWPGKDELQQAITSEQQDMEEKLGAVARAFADKANGPLLFNGPQTFALLEESVKSLLALLGGPSQDFGAEVAQNLSAQDPRQSPRLAALVERLAGPAGEDIDHLSPQDTRLVGTQENVVGRYLAIMMVESLISDTRRAMHYSDNAHTKYLHALAKPTQKHTLPF